MKHYEIVDLKAARELLEAHGYKVTLPRAPKKPTRTLNALGKPYGANFDPDYKMKYRFSWASLRKPYGSSMRWVGE